MHLRDANKIGCVAGIGMRTRTPGLPLLATDATGAMLGRLSNSKLRAICSAKRCKFGDTSSKDTFS